MPKEGVGGGGEQTKADDRATIRKLIRQLEQANNPLTDQNGNPLPLDEALIEDLENQLDAILDTRPGLAGFAQKKGYDYVPPDDGEGNGNGNKNKNKDKDEEKKGPGSKHTDPGYSRKLPPGYRAVRGGDGNIYLVWNSKYGPKGNRKDFPGLWQLKENQLDQYGIKKSDIKNVSEDQWARLKKNKFGYVGDIEFRGRHPIRAFMEEMSQLYGIAPGMLRNRGVMEVLFEAWMEEKDAGWITSQLKQTDWWDNKTKQRRQWIFDMSAADRKDTVQRVLDSAKQLAVDRFGAVNWMDHIDIKDLDAWAKKVASGVIGWDSNTLQNKIENLARGVVGTTAFVEWEQQTPGTPQDIDSAFEDVRSAAINWMGHFAKPSQGELKDWATKIATGALTMDQFNAMMRKRKQDMFPWLSPDEGYLERSGSYKNIAERLFGTTIGWDDRTLADLTGRDKNGASTGTAMTLDEYDKYIRKNDSRFWEGPVAKEEGLNLVNFLKGMFAGGG